MSTSGRDLSSDASDLIVGETPEAEPKVLKSTSLKAFRFLPPDSSPETDSDVGAGDGLHKGPKAASFGNKMDQKYLVSRAQMVALIEDSSSSEDERKQEASLKNHIVVESSPDADLADRLTDLSLHEESLLKRPKKPRQRVVFLSDSEDETKENIDRSSSRAQEEASQLPKPPSHTSFTRPEKSPAVLKSRNNRNTANELLRLELERRRKAKEFQPELIVSGEKLSQVVLERDANNVPVVQVHEKLVRFMKPHQAEGVTFMYTSTLEAGSTNGSGSGCILAHCMGLGKTLQTIIYLHTVLSANKCRTALILTPVNTCLNWSREFSMWLDSNYLHINVFDLPSSVKGASGRLEVCKEWQRKGGVLIMGYTMFRNMAKGVGVKSSQQREYFEKYLLDPGPDVIICDEGHLLKNEKSALNVAVNRVKSLRRICLTGTPMQNNLLEYHTMVQFVRPGLLGTSAVFRMRFVNPITKGQCADSSPYEVRIMKRLTHILHKIVEGCIHRKDYSCLTQFLPPKHEFVLSVRLTKRQCELYKHYLTEVVKELDFAALKARKNLFADFENLKRICTHPYALILQHSKSNTKGKSGELDSFIVESDQENESEDSEPEQKSGELSSSESADESHKLWYKDFVSDKDASNFDLSGKFVLLREILNKCEEKGDKLLVFSQSLVALSLIEDMLHSLASDEDKLTAVQQAMRWEWVNGLDYFRLDGSTKPLLRERYAKAFNDRENLRARLFLISTRAGGIGINLVGANRVVIFDVSWNPANDIQSIFRAYRFGQMKPVYVYRFVAQGTMEEKVYDRQVHKLSMSSRVVDEHQIERHFTAADLEELYMFTPLPIGSKHKLATPDLPKDDVMADLLLERTEVLVSFHEHDSLLENKADEQLSEEERRAAWAEYQQEKSGAHFIPLGKKPARQPKSATALQKRMAANAFRPQPSGQQRGREQQDIAFVDDLRNAFSEFRL